jgi:hypothetical protein
VVGKLAEIDEDLPIQIVTDREPPLDDDVVELAAAHEHSELDVAGARRDRLEADLDIGRCREPAHALTLGVGGRAGDSDAKHDPLREREGDGIADRSAPLGVRVGAVLTTAALARGEEENESGE